MVNHVVLITGALTAIGRAAAVAFARAGHRIFASSRHPEAGETLAAELRTLGTAAEFISADVPREDDLRDLVDQTVAHFGRLDAAANNAGAKGKPGAVTDQTAESYRAECWSARLAAETCALKTPTGDATATHVILRQEGFDSHPRQGNRVNV